MEGWRDFVSRLGGSCLKFSLQSLSISSAGNLAKAIVWLRKLFLISVVILPPFVHTWNVCHRWFASNNFFLIYKLNYFSKNYNRRFQNKATQKCSNIDFCENKELHSKIQNYLRKNYQLSNYGNPRNTVNFGYKRSAKTSLISLL